MLFHRMMQQSTRRLATIRPATTTTSIISRTPQILASQFTCSARRSAETTPVSASQANDTILARQRLNRPVSPHLTIYKPQVTWILSAMNRITGSILSGGFYVFGAAYLAAPLLGWHLESAAMAASVTAWPVALKFLAKFSLSLPFTFHSFNGIRHLIWDMGQQINNKQVIQTGWACVGLTFASSLALALI